MTKCYIVEINSSLGGMFERLFEANILNYNYHAIDGTHIEITFPNIKNVVELEKIMRWYV